MNAVTKIEPSPLAKLREPFPEHQISKKPAPTKAQNDAVKADYRKGIRCPECGGWHHPEVVHLDYVGHAAATDRLLDADERWGWEPVADPASLGLPVTPGGMWIKLTVDGHSRYGFGCADGKTGGNAVKEIIGDAIRNAGMRFGMALDLWHKGDLHGDEADHAEETGKPQTDARQSTPDRMPAEALEKLNGLLRATKTAADTLTEHYRVKDLRDLNSRQYNEVIDRLEQRLAEAAKAETNRAGQSGADFNLDDEIKF